MDSKEYNEKEQIMKERLYKQLGQEKHYTFYKELFSVSERDIGFSVFERCPRPFQFFRSALISYVYGNRLGCLAYCVVAIDIITVALIDHAVGKGIAVKANGYEDPLNTLFTNIKKKKYGDINLPKSIIESFGYIISARNSLAHPAHEGLDNLLKKDDDYSILRKMLKITIELLREFYSILEKSPPK